MYQLSLLFSPFANLLAYNGAALQSSVKQVGSLAFYSIVSSLSLARVRTLFYILCDWQHSKISPNTRQSIYLYINVDWWRLYGIKYIKHIANNAQAAQ
jgi:hypothetical protein